MKKIISNYKKLPLTLKATLWFLFSSLIQKTVSFITVPIFTRMMSTAEYGMYNNYISWESIFMAFCTLNMHSVIYVNNYTKASNQKDKDFAAIPLLSLSITITCILFVIYLLFHRFFDNLIGMPFELIALLFIQILFEPAINFWNMKQRFDYKYVIMVLRTIIMVILNASLGVIFVIYSDGNEALARAISIVLVYVFFGILSYIYFFRRAKVFYSTNGWKHALNVELPLLPHSLSLTVLASSDKIMISRLVSLAKAGIYSVAYSAGYVVNVLKTSIVDALKPWIYNKIKNKDYNAIKPTVNIVLLIVTLITIFFIALAPELIILLSPEEYFEAIYVIPPVAASSFFTFLYNIFSIVSLYYEKTKKVMMASIIGAILNIILNFICIPLFGYIAAGFTTMICYIVFSVVHYNIMKNTISENNINSEIYDVKSFIVLSIIIVLCTIIFEFLYSSIIVRYMIIILVVIISIIFRKKVISTINLLRKGRK